MSPSTLREAAFHVLTALAARPHHGYTLIEEVARLSGGRVRLRTGTVYSLLDQLRVAGLIEIDREEVVSSRLRRYFRLTVSGAALLAAECGELRRRAEVAEGYLRTVGPHHGGRAVPPAAPHPGAARLGHDEAPPAGAFVHPGLFYRDAADYLAGTVPFIVEGLLAGEPVAVSVPRANLELIRDELGREASRVHLLDMEVAGRNPGRIISTILMAFVQAHAGRTVRIIGEPIWPSRTSTEYPACAQHEALINLAFAGHPVTILCPYDVVRLSPQVLSDAARTHPVVVHGSGLQRSDAYAPDRVLDDYNLPLSADAVCAFEFGSDNLPQAQAHAATVAACLGVPLARRTEVERAVSELTANSVRHGGGQGRLRVWPSEGQLACQVEDAGTLSDPLAGRRPVSEHETGGRGLLIVNRIADLVRVHAIAGSTTIRAYFEIA
jgi:DNA-binding PadR family transcriptional regulator/anti-sigma regulatory factor (Ser/Thr protein kinase)